METELQQNIGIVEQVSKSDILGLEVPSWDKPRTTEQLRGFIARHEAEMADDCDDLAA
jgi:hypothetical protein